jgi:hypothetical protein
MSVVHSYLKRVVDTFLYDDVEVPSLVTLMTGTDVDAEPQLVLFLPSSVVWKPASQACVLTL